MAQRTPARRPLDGWRRAPAQRKRNLGHREHRRLYNEARKAMAQAIDEVMPPPPDPAPMQ